MNKPIEWIVDHIRSLPSHTSYQSLEEASIMPPTKTLSSSQMNDILLSFNQEINQMEQNFDNIDCQEPGDQEGWKMLSTDQE